MKKALIFYGFVMLMCCNSINAQTMVTRTIQSFGAKGDGKTNDMAAFEKASTFFNKRGGYGKLIIGAGTYIVGKQVSSKIEKGRFGINGKHILDFKSIKNLTIEGKPGAVIKYRDSLLFGSFDPETGLPYTKTTRDFYDESYGAQIGACVYLEKCYNIKVSGLTLNGNSNKIKFGGIWGDVGIQLWHIGVFIITSKNVVVDKVNASYFGLDGICVWNFSNDTTDNIKILNSVFEYNSRQGFSWIGGNQLYVKNSKFNNTGRGKYASMPMAGVDIEAAGTKVRNGVFEDCEFANNTGCGLTADQGDNADCKFINCTFWGVTNYSAWVKMPGFRFYNCKLYGTFVHGYKAMKDEEATQFINCWFEDKPYQGKEPFGQFLVEANSARRMLFDTCTFVVNKKSFSWIQLDTIPSEDDYYKIFNSKFIVKGTAKTKGEFTAVLRRVKFKNNTIEFNAPKAKELYQWPPACCTNLMDLGGNKVVFKE